MSELLTRALTGAAYVALTLGAAWAGPFSTALLFLPVCAIAAHEFHRLYWRADEGPLPLWSVLLASTVYVTVALGAVLPHWQAGYAVGLSFMLLLIGVTMSLRRGAAAPAEEFGGQLLLIAYIALPFALLPHLLSEGPYILMGTFFLLWTNDTGAYLVGRSVGRTKLLPSVSPKKTIEGLLGGVALTLVVAWVLSRFWTVLPLQDWLVMGMLVSTTATLGDLLESAFKRARGVKDSGKVLPGHGGIMDRFDGFLLTIPAVFVHLHHLR